MAQELEKTWLKTKKEMRFSPAKNYAGPPKNYYSEEEELNEAQNGGFKKEEPYKGVPYRPGKKNGNGLNSSWSQLVPVEKQYYEQEEIEEELVEERELDEPKKRNTSGLNYIFATLFIIAVIVGVAYFIYRYFMNKSPKVQLPQNDLNTRAPNEISLSELQLQLQAALETKNYKAVTRIYLLFALKHYIEKNSIIWKKNKTNHHYISELRGQATQHSFKTLVQWYEKVWYGESPFGLIEFEAIEKQLAFHYSEIEKA